MRKFLIVLTPIPFQLIEKIINLSNISESFGNIPLETVSPMNHIFKIVIYELLILYQYSFPNGQQAFRKDGSFFCNIGKVGNGPCEFRF